MMSLKHRNTTRILSGIVLLTVLTLLAGPSLENSFSYALEPVDLPHQEEENAGCRVVLVESTADRIVLDFWASDFQVAPVSGPEGEQYQLLKVPGCTLLDISEEPRLPLKAELLGIPPESEFQISVLEARTDALPGPYSIPPASQPKIEWPDLRQAPADAGPQRIGTQWLKDDGVYAADALYPAQPALTLEPGFVRQQRVVPVHFYPIQYNPVSGEILFHRYLRIALDFQYPQGRPLDLADRPEPPSFEQVLESGLLNYDLARGWRAPRTQGVSDVPWPPPEPGYKVRVEQAGIHRLTYAELQAAGLPVDTLDPQTFQVFADGTEVAIYVEGEGDGSFDASDYVLFYSHNVGDKYTQTKTYWLTYDQESGVRMATRDGTPGGASSPPPYVAELHQEQNVNYWAYMPPSDDMDLERYFWDFQYAPGTLTYTVDLSDLATGSFSATLRVSILGYNEDPADPDHHTQYYVNGNYVDESWWNGIVRLTEVFSFSQAFLQEGSNEIVFQFPKAPGAAQDVQLLDWFELGFHREYVVQGSRLSFASPTAGLWEYLLQGFATDDIWLFDVTDPGNAVQITGGVVESGANYNLRFEDNVVTEIQYASASSSAFLSPVDIVLDTPSDWGSPDNGADYIIITHADFMSQAAEMQAQKESLGHRVALVDVEDVYDEFGYGMLSPHAIHDFLTYTYANWVLPAPAYVLLIGDGHYDYKDIQGFGKGRYLPPWMDFVDLVRGESPTDNRYVTIVGSDTLPDMHIGRMTVNDTGEAGATVDKALNYPFAEDGAWRGKLLMIADDPDPAAGDFFALSDELLDLYVKEPYNPIKVYQDDTIPGGTCAYDDPAVECKQDIIDGIDGGVFLVNYVGHAAIPWWADEHLFETGDVDSLQNYSWWPIVLGMDCNDGFFASPYPTVNALAEAFTRADSIGSVANWSSAAFGFAQDHQYLEYGFFQAIFLDDVRELGPATLAGKIVAWNEGALDAIDGYHLFGDPALYLRALDPDLYIEKTVEPVGQVEPGDIITYTLTFTNDGEGRAHHVVLTDIVPSALLSPTVIYASPEVLTQHTDITFTWDITNLVPGAAGEIQFRAVVSPAAEPGFIVVNEAEIASPLSRDVASTTTGISVPDMFVSKSGPAATTFSQTITYTINWGNVGQAGAPGVRLTDTLPAWVSYVGDSSGFDSTYDPGTHRVAWEVPYEVAAGTGETFVLTGWVTMDPDMAGPLVNEIEISTSLPDGDPNNDQSQATTVLLLPDLAVQAGGPPAASAGSLISFTVAYSNVGDAAAVGVVISDVLPPGVTYLGDDSGLAHSEPLPGTHVWQVGALPAGGQGGFAIAAQLGTLDETGSVVTNTVTIGSASPDPNDTNATSQWSMAVTPTGSEIQVYLPLILRNQP